MLNKPAAEPYNFPSEENSMIASSPLSTPIKIRHSRFFSIFCRCFQKSQPQTFEEITLLPPDQNSKKKTLILDLDETLVHSSTEPLPNPDLTLNVEINNSEMKIFVLVRPFTFEFIEKAAEHYEIVIFTASLKSYAGPVIDFIDRSKVVSGRLFRSECINYNGNFVKNLSALGRDLKKVVIVDNSPFSYIFHPHNALPISSWFEDKTDNKLLDVLKILQALNTAEDIPEVLKKLKERCLEVSLGNVNDVLGQFGLGRSVLNSPKPAEMNKFDYREN